jgi:ADP-heptose:LPS heptosyltransferase
MYEALDQRDFGKHFKEENGDYIVSFFSELGMFSEWIKSIPIDEIYSMLKEIYTSTKSKIVLTGCEWDLDFNKKLLALDKSNIFIDMVGKTTNDQFFGLIKESKGFIGWCGGNTVMSVVLKIPTIIFWSNKHFKNEGFYTNCCPPEGVGKWYFPQVAERFNKKEVIDTAKKVFK